MAFDARNTSSYEGGKVPDNNLRQIFHKYELKEELAREQRLHVDREDGGPRSR